MSRRCEVRRGPKVVWDREREPSKPHFGQNCCLKPNEDLYFCKTKSFPQINTPFTFIMSQYYGPWNMLGQKSPVHWKLTLPRSVKCPHFPPVSFFLSFFKCKALKVTFPFFSIDTTYLSWGVEGKISTNLGSLILWKTLYILLHFRLQKKKSDVDVRWTKWGPGERWGDIIS